MEWNGGGGGGGAPSRDGDSGAEDDESALLLIHGSGSGRVRTCCSRLRFFFYPAGEDGQDLAAHADAGGEV